MLTLGGSFVSKYEGDDDPLYEFPENVGLYAARVNYTTAKWNIYTEYAHKINDPNTSNENIYKDGQALMLNATYSVKGLGVSAGAHSYDNMVFRSGRGAGPFDLNINFQPPLAKQHTYNLPATLYPYATQANGEVGYQGEVFYKFKKGSKLGGTRGMKLAVNWSGAWSLDSTRIPNDTVRFDGYTTNFFSLGERNYYQDLNVELRKKVSEHWELALTYLNFVYDIAQVQGKPGKSDDLRGHVRAGGNAQLQRPQQRSLRTAAPEHQAGPGQLGHRRGGVHLQPPLVPGGHGPVQLRGQCGDRADPLPHRFHRLHPRR